MLLDELKLSIQNMTEVRDLEKAAGDIQKQEKTDANYTAAVTENARVVSAIDASASQVSFRPSSELVRMIKQVLEDSRKCIETGFAQDAKIRFIQNETKSIKERFASEWSEFYKGVSAKSTRTLVTVQSITPDRDKTGYTIKKIQSGVNIDYDYNKNVRLLAEGMAEGDKILQGLGLNDEIMSFLDKVSEGQARITDLSDSIITWIHKEGLINKFTIDLL